MDFLMELVIEFISAFFETVFEVIFEGIFSKVPRFLRILLKIILIIVLGCISMGILALGIKQKNWLLIVIGAFWAVLFIIVYCVKKLRKD
ncbi:MAG: hypothetical protein K2M46_07110 [Lachnospiraceae bacterium]|nr:hypothetical protein [Lachnospiraceae bacterium]